MARIIIIDDDAVLRETLLTLLTEAGHSAVAATNGFEGLQLLRAAPADLILTDLQMPYGGLPTIRVLRTEFPKVGIIAMSGAGKLRLDIAGTLGANRTLAKPFSAEELAAAIAEVLGKPSA